MALSEPGRPLPYFDLVAISRVFGEPIDPERPLVATCKRGALPPKMTVIAIGLDDPNL
jgi:hypothetical protein